ncbi:Flp family type IVb pilin [Edaphosphingomonas haloaromaticamans]|uniref:Flp/Fap pilin component n=1 Tax=Edaphosphingomonas haloaromaticamans TaxID=653954 RepID=A0A1S1H9S1_9SPHN|nr:Flp family type IVb pilin [Sphingomonas haloaromaticamans]OHT18939.1 Flp/Fap pilin component [Sphingomonas haloaromaticamans]
MGYLLHRLAGNDRGATAIEYGLILAFIAMAMVGVLSQVAGTTIDMWQHVADKVADNS